MFEISVSSARAITDVSIGDLAPLCALRALIPKLDGGCEWMLDLRGSA